MSTLHIEDHCITIVTEVIQKALRGVLVEHSIFTTAVLCPRDIVAVDNRRADIPQFLSALTDLRKPQT